MRLQKKGKLQRATVDKYIKKVHSYIADTVAKFKRKKVENTVKGLTVDGKFSPNEFHKFKKVLCPRSKMEKTSVILGNGDEVYGDQAVNDAYKEEFECRLSQFKIKPEYSEYEKLTNSANCT